MSGTCKSQWVDPDHVETEFGGYVTLAVAELGREEAFALVGDRAVRSSMVDVSAIAGYEAAVRKAGFAWMKAFRSRGGERMYVVTSMGVVRMMGSALAFATGMPVSFVATRDAARARIRART